jgi:hypothetical protein
MPIMTAPRPKEVDSAPQTLPPVAKVPAHPVKILIADDEHLVASGLAMNLR